MTSAGKMFLQGRNSRNAPKQLFWLLMRDDGLWIVLIMSSICPERESPTLED